MTTITRTTNHPAHAAPKTERDRMFEMRALSTAMKGIRVPLIGAHHYPSATETVEAQRAQWAFGKRVSA